MFRMLTCFHLSADETIGRFQVALDELTHHLVERDLVDSTGPVGRRQRHEIMDTDDERDHEFFFLMNFRDRAQCDRAVELLSPGNPATSAVHKAVYSKVRDPVFICWEDIGGGS